MCDAHNVWLDVKSWCRAIPEDTLGVGNYCAHKMSGTALPQLPPSKANASGKTAMIRKLKSGGYRLYSRKVNPKTGKRRNLGTFETRAEAQEHERAVQYFKRRK
jgi:hypothetical protein